MQMDLGWAKLELFPSAAYSVCASAPAGVLGFAFERQRGVHAIGGERRRDFDAWPGELAWAVPGVEIFSESARGGEYLALHTAPGLGPQGPGAGAAPRTVFPGDRQAVRLAGALRLLMHAGAPQRPLLEQGAALLLERAFALSGRPPRRGAYGLDRQAHARVLDHVEAALDGPLGLDELARVAGLPLLRFLRSFDAAVGRTPHAYITERRLQRARALLHADGAGLADVAAACGFAHQSHLGAVFKAQLGLSPRQYRLRAGRHSRTAA